ncbi:acyl-CoA dehydrogenase NM domain-like protein [Imleria badia]|nr:acyl-CoA dehydrogenase NM domain-like protein [Imleria badia]
MRVEDGFQLTHFTERNAYLSDPVLPNLLKRVLPSKIANEIEHDLVRFGMEVNTSVRAISERATPPRLTQYNHWGQRVDQLDTSEAWKELKSVFFKEGIPGIFYERKYGEFSRIYGFVKLHMLVGDSHVVGCPISMTDGCARVLELIGTPEMKTTLFPRLISRDPSFAFTSGQWMTERPGGSDVSLTETIAVPTESSGDQMWPAYQLDGFKWFSSATDSNVSVALARTGDIKDGSRSLSLFLVPLRTPLIPQPGEPIPSSISNGIYTHRLKNKIGTHMIPTAELSLKATTAYLLGSLNHGVKNIITVLYITRIHSAISGTGHLRKCLEIAIAYSKVRRISGGEQLLTENAVHVAQLASISLVYRALTHLVFGTILFMGKVEANIASKDDESLLRILTAVVKAFTAEKAVSAMEECMTTLGGMGYMEEVGIGRSIRDGLVEKIWEGTTSVLALDLVRSASDPTTFRAFRNWGTKILDSCPLELRSKVRAPLEVVKAAFQTIDEIYGHPTRMSPLMPRPGLMVMGHAAAAAMLLEHAVWSHNVKTSDRDADTEVFVRWVNEGGLSSSLREVLEIAPGHNGERISMNSTLAYGPKL